jgi:hypothetical protein
MIVVHVQLDSSTISPGKTLVLFYFILFLFLYIRGGFMEVKEINKESSKLLFPKALVLVAAKSCVK